MKKVIETTNAPSAIGPYSQGIQAGNLVFVSGQIPFVPATMELVSDKIEDQTRQALENVKGILEAAGLSLNQVVKTTVFLKDLSEFNAMNGVYAEFFSENKPARACVEVSRLPRDVRVEIEAIAIQE